MKYTESVQYKYITKLLMEWEGSYVSIYVPAIEVVLVYAF
jgi:hypothetical protein